MSQLKHADFCGSDRLIERRIHWWQRQWRRLLGDTGSQGYWYSSI